VNVAKTAEPICAWCGLSVKLLWPPVFLWLIEWLIFKFLIPFMFTTSGLDLAIYFTRHFFIVLQLTSARLFFPYADSTTFLEFHLASLCCLHSLLPGPDTPLLCCCTEILSLANSVMTFRRGHVSTTCYYRAMLRQRGIWCGPVFVDVFVCLSVASQRLLNSANHTAR